MFWFRDCDDDNDDDVLGAQFECGPSICIGTTKAWWVVAMYPILIH
jgi:hypothetical protein